MVAARIIAAVQEKNKKDVLVSICLLLPSYGLRHHHVSSVATSLFGRVF